MSRAAWSAAAQVGAARAAVPRAVRRGRRQGARPEPRARLEPPRRLRRRPRGREHRPPAIRRSSMSGTYGAANGALTYAAHGEHRSFSAVGTSTGRYYPDLGAAERASKAAAAWRSRLISAGGRRSTSAQSFAYQPYYDINFLSSLVPSARGAGRRRSTSPAQIALSSREQLRSGRPLRADADPRRAVVAPGGLQLSIDASSAAATRPSAGGLPTSRSPRNLTRNAALRVGYGYGVGKNTIAGVRIDRRITTSISGSTTTVSCRSPVAPAISFSSGFDGGGRRRHRPDTA